MKTSKIYKMMITNYTDVISNEEIYYTFKYLDSKYKNVSCNVFLHKNFKSYFVQCIKRHGILFISFALIDWVLGRSRNSIRFGHYRRDLKEINIFESEIRRYLSIIHKQFIEQENGRHITSEIWNYYESKWIRYMIITTLLHELIHTFQKENKKLNIKTLIKQFRTKWEDRKSEIEAVKKSEQVINRIHTKICRELNVEGIEIAYQYNPLSPGYKYNIRITKENDTID